MIIDRFGKEVMMIPADPEHFTVNVTVMVSSVFLGWVFSLGERVKILGPRKSWRRCGKKENGWCGSMAGNDRREKSQMEG